MRWFFAALIVSAMMVIFGCKAVPDEDDMDRLRNQVASIPIEMRVVMGRWAANRVAYGYLRNSFDRDREEIFGTIRCIDGAQSPTDPVIDLKLPEMFACLNKNLTSTYFDCLTIILDDIQDQHPGLNCRWLDSRYGLTPDEAPPEFSSERITDDGIVRALLGPPPPIEIQLMLMGLPGFVGPGGALCPQGVDWACADNPLDDAPPSTSAASGGGDR